MATRRKANCSSERPADRCAWRRNRAANSPTTTPVAKNTARAANSPESPTRTEPSGDANRKANATALRIEVTAASTVPHTMATTRTARRYSTSRLNAGTCGSRSPMRPLTTATAVTLASSPLSQRTTDGRAQLSAISPLPP